MLEHGDLSHPNLLVRNGRVAVIDWELAETQGLPATDLFFFLAYVAGALSRAQSSGDSVAAVDRAFFGRRSWARTHRPYAQAMALPQDMLTPLFIACWARQVSGLARRMADGGENSGRTPGSGAEWVYQDWRFAVWRHAVDSAHRPCWDDLP